MTAQKTKIMTYSELITLDTFKERFDYLKLDGVVGKTTFGVERIFNQKFYSSLEWKSIRDYVILRDLGCDLGLEGYEINGASPRIHHMNPITMGDLERRTDILLDPEYLITTSLKTHNMIHYGDELLLSVSFEERKPNDTCLWRR